jgi:hydroxyethylthiazole kinase-like sugar kinase family protein
VFAAAGERAAEKAAGPGGLAVGLLDELHRIGCSDEEGHRSLSAVP